MRYWVQFLNSENPGLIDDIAQLLSDNNLLTKEDVENLYSDYDYERISDMLYDNYFEKYERVYTNRFSKPRNAMKFIEETIIPQMLKEQQELNDFDEMLPVDEQIEELEQKLAELKNLRRQMRENPPPPPQPLPKYIDDPKNKFRMMKTKLANQIPILMKPYKQFKIKKPEDEAIELINNTNTNNTLQFSNSVLMILEPENEELCYQKLRDAKRGFNKDKFATEFDEPVSNYYLNNLNSLDAINNFINKIYDQEIKIFSAISSGVKCLNI